MKTCQACRQRITGGDDDVYKTDPTIEVDAYFHRTCYADLVRAVNFRRVGRRRQWQRTYGRRFAELAAALFLVLLVRFGSLLALLTTDH